MSWFQVTIGTQKIWTRMLNVINNLINQAANFETEKGTERPKSFGQGYWEIRIQM